MKRYIEQLIEDLEQVANNPPPPVQIKGDPDVDEQTLKIAELIVVPFQPISEWTRLEQDVFPDMAYLSPEEHKSVNEAIFKVFDSLRLTLADLPPELPPGQLYRVLTTNWDYQVQYLPSLGMDVTFCTGNPATCPYGKYCDCHKNFRWEVSDT